MLLSADLPRSLTVPLVTVGLPFKNDRRTLLDAVRSVLAQDLRDFELLLVDDGSTDGSLELARAVRDDRVRVISDGQNKKLAARLNQIAREARAPLLARMDSDDLMHPERLARQVAQFEARPDLSILGTATYTMDNALRVRGRRGDGPLDLSPAGVLEHGLFIHPTVMKRTAWARAHPYDEALPRAQDLDLWFRILGERGIGLLSEPLYFYRESPQINLLNYLRSNEIRRELLARYGPGAVGAARTALLRARVSAQSAAYQVLRSPRLRAMMVARRSHELDPAEMARAQAVVDRIRAVPVPVEPPSAGPRVTVGLPFYNAKKTLLGTVRSVFAQSFTDWELILLDDGSTDGSADLVRKLDDPRVRVISDGQNLKLSARLNQLALLARAPLVARMDSDDLMHPERLARQVAFLEARPEVDLVGTAAVSIDGSDLPQGIRGDEPLPLSVHGVLARGLFIHPSVMARTAWMRRNPYALDAVRAEDQELWVRVFDQANFAHMPEPLLFYRETLPINLGAYRATQATRRKLLLSTGRAQVGLASALWLSGTSLAKEAAYVAARWLGGEQRLLRLRSHEMTEEQVREVARLVEQIHATKLPGL
jgi:glycosyltransferase involved in cell wall biosynthesis